MTHFESPISAEDIATYLERNSDFAFEARTVKLLTSLKFTCEHSGTYTDTVSKKIRQFDIRAFKALDSIRQAFLSVECKNLSVARPLVVHRVKRESQEAGSAFILIPNSTHLKDYITDAGCREIVEVPPRTSMYAAGEWVGKSMDCLLKNANGTITSKDSEVFEKYSQALSSATAQIEDISKMRPLTETRAVIVLPILVVPDETLWAADYEADGTSAGPASKQRHVSFYVNRKTDVSFGLAEQKFSISHFDIVTASYLEKFVNSVLQTNFHDHTFPHLGFGTQNFLRDYLQSRGITH